MESVSLSVLLESLFNVPGLFLLALVFVSIVLLELCWRRKISSGAFLSLVCIFSISSGIVVIDITNDVSERSIGICSAEQVLLQAFGFVWGFTLVAFTTPVTNARKFKEAVGM